MYRISVHENPALRTRDLCHGRKFQCQVPCSGKRFEDRCIRDCVWSCRSHANIGQFNTLINYTEDNGRRNWCIQGLFLYSCGYILYFDLTEISLFVHRTFCQWTDNLASQIIFSCYLNNDQHGKMSSDFSLKIQRLFSIFSDHLLMEGMNFFLDGFESIENHILIERNELHIFRCYHSRF